MVNVEFGSDAHRASLATNNLAIVAGPCKQRSTSCRADKMSHNLSVLLFAPFCDPGKVSFF